MRGDLIAVYMMASRRNGTLYTGSTTDLIARAHQHRHGLVDGFTKRYGCVLLVWYESHEELEAARLAELRLKRWNRAWKLRLIEGANPGWHDLYPGMVGELDPRLRGGAATPRPEPEPSPQAPTPLTPAP